MRNRIRIILVLMCTCILGVFVFQGYWIYNAYQVKLQDFNRDINDALRTALQKKQFSDARLFFATGVPAQTIAVRRGGTPPPEETGIAGVTAPIRRATHIINLQTTTVRKDSGEKAYTRVFEADNGKVQVRLFPGDSLKRIYADSLSKTMSDLMIANKFYDHRISAKSVDSAYGQELAARGISTAYTLDSIKMDMAALRLFNTENRNPLESYITPLNPFSDYAIRARFTSPMLHILRQMLGTLLGSAALLVLTVICFVYMLRTILQQKKLSEVKNDFINNMTHELKTPIATVSAAVEAMQNFNALNDTQKTQSYLSISRQELLRLSDLVEKVLHIAAEEKENFELNYETTDINDLVRSIVANHRLKANKNVDFSYTVLSDPLVAADRTHLANAINNLVDNAIKYSGDPAVVNIQIAKEGLHLKITVKDNGMGIPANYQESIFEKFFRVPNGNLHNVKGFGLGLSYVKKIAEMHGGAVRVKSLPEKGSEFTLEIPVG